MALRYDVYNALVEQGYLRVLKPGELAVLVCLGRFFNQRRRAWPSRELVIELTGLHPETVSIAVRGLASLGIVDIKAEQRRGRYRSYPLQVYVLNLPEQWKPPQHKAEIPTPTTKHGPENPSRDTGTIRAVPSEFPADTNGISGAEIAKGPASSDGPRPERFIERNMEREKAGPSYPRPFRERTRPAHLESRLMIFRVLRGVDASDLQQVIEKTRRTATARSCGWLEETLRSRLDQYAAARLRPR